MIGELLLTAVADDHVHAGDIPDLLRTRFSITARDHDPSPPAPLYRRPDRLAALVIALRRDRTGVDNVHVRFVVKGHYGIPRGSERLAHEVRLVLVDLAPECRKGYT